MKINFLGLKVDINHGVYCAYRTANVEVKMVGARWNGSAELPFFFASSGSICVHRFVLRVDRSVRTQTACRTAARCGRGGPAPCSPAPCSPAALQPCALQPSPSRQRATAGFIPIIRGKQSEDGAARWCSGHGTRAKYSEAARAVLKQSGSATEWYLFSDAGT